MTNLTNIVPGYIDFQIYNKVIINIRLGVNSSYHLVQIHKV